MTSAASRPDILESEHDQPTLVLTSSLVRTFSPRLAGLDEQHALMLSEVETPLPPILVQRGSMRVIDGMHRLRAAQLKHRTHVTVRFFDGSDSTAYLRAVSENIQHGLPLSVADRKAAALSIVKFYPDWSDRAIAQAAGISAKTVAALRRGLADVHAAPATRVGLDGRIRPVDAAANRERVVDLLRCRPNDSVRAIARATGVSTATVRHIRDQLRPSTNATADHPEVVDETRMDAGSTPMPAGGAVEDIDVAGVLDNLRRDPSLRYTDSGRGALRWLGIHLISGVEDQALAAAIPAHWVPAVARLARHSANRWGSLAELLDRRARDQD
jgi:ParB-like chromosome segregation protein Spo0J